MPNNYDIAFTHSHRLMEDGSVIFRCSNDVKKWPWLKLPGSHPIVVQTINYWASVETGKTRGTFDPTKWSALTYSKWETGNPSAGPVSHGIADAPPGNLEKDRPGFRLTFFDGSGELVCRLIGTGVVFHNRDFEAWRDEAKDKTDLSHSIESFEFADASSLGVESEIERFLSPLRKGAEVTAEALITKENGLMPIHPYHSGSGDHVNANHLLDVAFQFAHLFVGSPIHCTGGEIKFRHYVELGKPFTITLARSANDSVSMVVHQDESKCTDVVLNYEPY